MMKCGNAVFVGGVNVGTGLQQLRKSPALVCRLGVALTTNIEELVFHSSWRVFTHQI
jgi:hypothetical protein